MPFLPIISRGRRVRRDKERDDSVIIGGGGGHWSWADRCHLPCSILQYTDRFKICELVCLTRYRRIKDKIVNPNPNVRYGTWFWLVVTD